MAEKLQNKRAIILSHQFSKKNDYLQLIWTTQNKTYQLWCFIFIQRTYFAILHLRNLNFDFLQFFLSKHLLCSALRIFFYGFHSAAFIIYFHICGVMYFQENTLILAHSPHNHFIEWFFFMGSNSSNKTSLLPQKNAGKTDLNLLFLYLFFWIMLNHCITRWWAGYAQILDI